MKYPDNQLNFIIISQQPWDIEIGSNCKNIAIELSKEHKVLYINSPLDRITLYKNANDPAITKRLNVIKKKEAGLIEIKENLWNLYPDCIVESINWINNEVIFNALNKRNNTKLAKSIQKGIEQLNFKNYILLNDNEMFKGFFLKELLQPKVSIYYSRDFMLAVDYWKKHGKKIEPKLIGKSDICFANSTYLRNYCKQFNQNSHYVGQGCDIDSFQNSHLKRPDDLSQFNNKIIGYVGALNSFRLDIDVIETIALHFREYEIVLVGSEDEDFKRSALHQMKNVHFLGQKHVEELPAYVNAFDLCINPQIINEVTIGNYPRKIDEYLALGKPIVATATQTMEIFKDYVYLANNKEDYINLITLALEENNDILVANRIKFVSGHTWENSVKAMLDQIFTFLNR